MNKRIITSLMLPLLLAAGSAMASSTVTVLLYSKPGGLLDAHNRALIDGLQKNGYKTDYKIVTGCKGVESWIKKNPDQPMVFNTMVAEEINRRLDPTADNACDLQITKDKLITLTYGGPYNFCTMEKDNAAALKHLTTARHIRIGVASIPNTNEIVANGLVKDLGVDAKVIPIVGVPKVVQALISGDIQYTASTNTQPFLAAGANCFLTVGDRDFAKRMNRISIDDVKPNSTWRGVSADFWYYGINVDSDAVRKIAIDVANNHPGLIKYLDSGFVKVGGAAGMDRAEEWQLFNRAVEKMLPTNR